MFVESIMDLYVFAVYYLFFGFTSTNSWVFCSVLEQPLKIPFVAATVLIANSQNSELAAEVLKAASATAQNYINIGAWREVKLVLRFLGCLQCIFEGDGIFPILEELFARAVDLQTASSEDVSSFVFSKSLIC